MTVRIKIYLVLILALLVSIASFSQTRKIKTSKGIDEGTLGKIDIDTLVPRTLFNVKASASENDSVTIAEILFNPEIKLIDPDTFKLDIVLATPDSSLLRRDRFRIIDVHPQDVIQENVLKLETKNKKAFIAFYGSIRVNGAMDFNGLQSIAGFNTYYIPVGPENSNARRFYMSASQTRFGIQGSSKTDYGPINFHIEGDFQGMQSSIFRIRHAYGQFNNILAGQTWSVFGDPFAIPWTVDSEGPNSSVNQRAVQVRYSNLINEQFRWMASMESPEIDFSSDTVSIYQGTPDLAGRLKYMYRKGHLQASFIIRSLGASRNNEQNTTSSMGVGGLFSGRYDAKKNVTFLFQLVGGRGIGRYIRTLKGTGNDLVLNPETGLFEPLTVYGGFVSLEYEWRENIFSFLTPGFTAVSNKSFQPEDAFSFSAYFSLNTFWDVAKGFRVGGEYSYGSRVNKNKESGTANRISFILYYSF
jgi:hypothetical protein